MQNIKSYYENLAILLKKHFDVNVSIEDIKDLKKDTFLLKNISFISEMFGDGLKKINIDTDIIFYKCNYSDKSKIRQINKLDLIKVQEKLSNILGLGFFVEKRHYKVQDLNFKIVDDILHCTFFSEITLSENEYFGREYFNRELPNKEDEQGSNEIIDENMQDLVRDKKYKYMQNLYIDNE